jgi:hypothetical protein
VRNSARQGGRPGLSHSGLTETLATSPGAADHQLSSTSNGKETEEQRIARLMAEQQAFAAVQLARKKQEWVSWVETEFTKCKNARLPFERQWYLNLAFANSRHYVSPVEVPGQGFRLTAPRAPAWRVRLVVNKVRSAVRKETAKLSVSRPVPTVVPATNEEEDFTAAQVAEQILKTAFGTADFLRTYRSWIWWGSICGVSFLKSYWSPNEPDSDLQMPLKPRLGMDGQPLMNPQTGEPIMGETEFVKGKIVTERITPFHIFVPDLLAEDLNKQPYIIHCTTRSPIWVERNFGFKPTPDTRASNTIMESAFIIAKNSEQHLDSVLVKEVWLKKDAHPDFPEGGLLTIISNRVVQHLEKWPWPFPEYPFYKYDGIPTGSFYSDSIIVDLIPLNKEYNRTRSQMIEIKNMMGKPKFLYPKGSINPRQISSEPGQGIPYIPGFDKPTVIAGVEVPASMHNELDRLNEDFDDISGQHEVSRGEAPTSITSGTAISYLQEQDDANLTYQVASIEYAIELLGKHYLKYVTRYWDEERLIKITGKDNDFEAKKWKGSDLRGNTDVKIQSGSALPYSKAARQAMVTEFMQYGWIDPATGLEIMQLGGFDKAVNQMLVDKKQAQRENMKMCDLTEEQCKQTMVPPSYVHPETQEEMYHEDGEGNYYTEPLIDPGTGEENPEAELWMPQPPIPVNSWDDHEQHVHWHNQYRKTQEFELLEDHKKEAFELHVQMHQQAMMGPLEGLYGPNSAHLDPEQAAMQQEDQQGQLAEAEGAVQQEGQTQLDQALSMSQIDANRSSVAANLARAKQQN